MISCGNRELIQNIDFINKTENAVISVLYFYLYFPGLILDKIPFKSVNVRPLVEFD